MSIFNLFKRRPQVLDVASFGPRLPLSEIESHLRNNPHVVQAVLQLCAFRRELCQRAVEDKSNLLHGQTAFESGAAAGMTDLMVTLEQVSQGKAASDGQLKVYFPE